MLLCVFWGTSSSGRLSVPSADEGASPGVSVAAGALISPVLGSALTFRTASSISSGSSFDHVLPLKFALSQVFISASTISPRATNHAALNSGNC